MGHKTNLGHHTDHGPMDLGLYKSLGEYCGHTASSRSVFLILVLTSDSKNRENAGCGQPSFWSQEVATIGNGNNNR